MQKNNRDLKIGSCGCLLMKINLLRLSGRIIKQNNWFELQQNFNYQTEKQK